MSDAKVRSGPWSKRQSLKNRLRVFYQENPSEWMTYDDIATKFDVSRAQAFYAVKNLRSTDALLETVTVVRVAGL